VPGRDRNLTIIWSMFAVDKMKMISVNKISSYSSNRGSSQEHISLIIMLFCFNEFAFTVQVKHKINSRPTQILGFILICLYFTTGHFHTCVFYKNVAYFHSNSWLSFQRLCRLLGRYIHIQAATETYLFAAWLNTCTIPRCCDVLQVWCYYIRLWLTYLLIY